MLVFPISVKGSDFLCDSPQINSLWKSSHQEGSICVEFHSLCPESSTEETLLCLDRKENSQSVQTSFLDRPSFYDFFIMLAAARGAKINPFSRLGIRQGLSYCLIIRAGLLIYKVECKHVGLCFHAREHFHTHTAHPHTNVLLILCIWKEILEVRT